MQSNIQHPLAFFEFFLTKENIENELKSFYNDMNEDYRIENIEYDKKVVLVLGEVEGGHLGINKYSFEDSLNSTLNNEFKISKAFIDEASSLYQSDEEQFEGYLKRQIKGINYIEYSLENLLSEYPYIIKPLERLRDYINQKYLYSKPIMGLHEPITPEVIIPQIFEFLIGDSNKGRFISQQDYELLTTYLLILVKENRLPTETKKITIKLDGGVLRFLFWVLHKEIFGKTKRPIFFDFMKSFFVQFNSVEVTTLKQKFATAPNFKLHPYLPEIVRSAKVKKT